MHIRSRKQKKIAERKGRKSADIFEIDDHVRVQDVASKKWNKTGRIVETRQSDDGQNMSFVVLMDNGHETIRHRSHLKHNITRYERSTDVRVKFQEEDKSTCGKVPDADRVENEESTNEEAEPGLSTGVTTRSMARKYEPLPDSDAPTKSRLKKRILVCHHSVYLSYKHKM